MTFIDFAAIKAKVGIEQAVSMLRLNMKKQGERLRGPCPVCKAGGDRALVITPDKGVFYCFGSCKTGGDMLELVARVKAYAGEDRARLAARDIARHFGVGNGSSREPITKQDESPGPLRPLDYLDAEHPSLRELGLAPETCQHFGAGYAPKGIMRGRLAIPIHDADGRLLAYCGRAVKGEEPTLIFPKGFEPESVVFNAHRLSEGELFVTRDPLAVLTAYQNAMTNVAAFLGPITARQLRQLATVMEEKSITSIELF